MTGDPVDERCEYLSKWGVHERCIRKPHTDDDHWFTTPQTEPEGAIYA